MSDSLQPHGLQHARLPCPSQSPGVCSNSCPLNQWCHPTISSSAAPFSSCPQSFPASGSFPVSQLFTSGGQSISYWDNLLRKPIVRQKNHSFFTVNYNFNKIPSNIYSEGNRQRQRNTVSEQIKATTNCITQKYWLVFWWCVFFHVKHIIVQLFFFNNSTICLEHCQLINIFQYCFNGYLDYYKVHPCSIFLQILFKSLDNFMRN